MYIYAVNTRKLLFTALLMKGTHHMTEEELKAKEEELTAKEADLQQKEADLQKREEDVNGLVSKMTKEYEAKLEKQKAEYEARLQEREKVISDLLSGNAPASNTPNVFEKLNERRNMQKRG